LLHARQVRDIFFTQNLSECCETFSEFSSGALYRKHTLIPVEKLS